MFAAVAFTSSFNTAISNAGHCARGTTDVHIRCTNSLKNVLKGTGPPLT